MKKIVVAMALDAQLQNRIIDQLTTIPWLSSAEVEFVHVFQEQNYPYMLPPTFYPDQDQKGEIKKTVEELLTKLTAKINCSKRSALCLFSESPKETMVEYIVKNKIDLVITEAREKSGLKGLFASSFTEYLVKHAPCRVLVLR